MLHKKKLGISRAFFVQQAVLTPALRAAPRGNTPSVPLEGG